MKKKIVSVIYLAEVMLCIIGIKTEWKFIKILFGQQLISTRQWYSILKVITRSSWRVNIGFMHGYISSCHWFLISRWRMFRGSCWLNLQLFLFHFFYPSLIMLQTFYSTSFYFIFFSLNSSIITFTTCTYFLVDVNCHFLYYLPFLVYTIFISIKYFTSL